MTGPGHLGTQLSALADGQLGPAATERAMAHVAACAECAAGLAAARESRRALSAAFEVRPTADLTARLLALGTDERGAPSPFAARPVPVSSQDPGAAWADSRSVALPTGRGRLPSGGLRGDVAPRRIPVAGLSAGVLAVALVAVLFVLGGEPTAVPARHPAQALGLLSSAAEAAQGAAGATAVVQEIPAVEVSDTSDVPGRAVGQDEGLPAWARSVPVPEGYRVTAVRADDDPVPSVEVDLVGPHGVVVVTQRLARLDLAPSDGLDVPAEPGSVTVLSAAPWHAVWQSGDVMVDVVAEVPSTAVADLVVAAPVQEYDDRPQARVVRGWQNLIESWSNL